MKKVAAALFIVMLLVFLAPCAGQAQEPGDDYQVEFKGKVGDDLDKLDVDQLLDIVSDILKDYNFSDDDVLDLTDATESFIKTVNDYSKKLKAAEPEAKITVPHDELKDYCNKLEVFLKKYKVTVEDTLKVGRAIASVAMSLKESKEISNEGVQGEDVKKTIASKEDVDAIFVRLMEFSKKHDILAYDFIPVIYRICDIGLTFMDHRVTLDKLKHAGGRWRKRLYDLGVSKEQADGLYDALVAFFYKYKIGLGEIIKLNKDINKLLKGNSSPNPDGESSPKKK
ncbi:MAG: hypothetical protein AB2L14_34470 [Candidatus Xenobiia bacterium LiM19]